MFHPSASGRASLLFPDGEHIAQPQPLSKRISLATTTGLGTVDIRPVPCCAKSLQAGNPPGSSVRGFLQARVLDWVAISFSVLLDYFSILSFWFVQVITHVRTFFLWRILFCYMFASDLVYPFTYQWTFGLLPPLGFCE